MTTPPACAAPAVRAHAGWGHSSNLDAAPSAAEFGRSFLSAERVGGNERHQPTTLRRSTTCLTPFVSRASRTA